jgi:hypothetical protein
MDAFPDGRSGGRRNAAQDGAGRLGDAPAKDVPAIGWRAVNEPHHGRSVSPIIFNPRTSCRISAGAAGRR